MTGQKAGDRLARLLLPYLVRDHHDGEDPDHEVGWWFRAAPPEVVLEALKLVHIPPGGERPNDQPPEEWLVMQAQCRGGGAGGALAGSWVAGYPGASCRFSGASTGMVALEVGSTADCCRLRARDGRSARPALGAGFGSSGLWVIRR